MGLETLTIIQPDDWHLHLRDGDLLTRTVPDAARQFHRAIVMPNLIPPVTETVQAKAYKARIEEQNTSLHALMTLYLTDNTRPSMVEEAHASGIIKAFKLYPAGATTHSDAGVTNIENAFAAIETMATLGMPLLVHGEVTHKDVDILIEKAALSTPFWHLCCNASLLYAWY